ncbi:hypothetical protein ACFPT7_23300 [Acidicapsa dinghuensis]|uniref:Uncharacterized protein n=1 Tax=Acidicapsa dinghuensis TaxID=2218256 RepID=A0ABW1ELY2_9BACT|nr:hypothetical protein [Acidicapsa dinghuensis]
MRKHIALFVMLLLGPTSAITVAQNNVESPADHPKPQDMELNLAKPFHTRSAWRLVVTEGPPVKDYGGNDAPGVLTVCLYKGPAGPCLSEPVALPLRTTTPDDPIAWEPHYLITARVVYPRGPKAAPFLLIITGSLLSGDSDQIVSTQLVDYDADNDTFRRVYGKSTGHNNNQEIRFITDGPLQGSVITAEPQEHLPYGYWIVVNKLAPDDVYHRVLRYRSATLYDDGNPLAVIDSEMPNIEQRLGLWKPGEPLPVPDVGGKGKPCTKPTLRHMELWCE